ncbi:thioredoxin domain-containing protein [Streptomyces sp. NPDC047046]|uniref:DsbA family protein n=1 Tax=Streptomyces sp. NPDC047046 TaxID=3155378 RepID=UPI0033CEFB41
MSAAAACGNAPRTGEDDPELRRAAAGPVPEKLDADGTTIHVGRKLAMGTMHVYEDPRCPVCKEFEDSDGARVLRESTERGYVSTDYTLASFLDDGLGGGGSKRAVNALRAALEEGHFAEYHDVLYAHQPEESVDGYTTARLLALASKVEGLRGPAFDKAVRTMRYADFVAESEAAVEKDRIQGTPSFFLDDELIANGTDDTVTTEAGMNLTLITRGSQQF